MTNLGPPQPAYPSRNRTERRRADHDERRGRSRQKEDFAPRLRRAEASEYLNEVHGLECAPATLAKKAVEGGGPRFRKYGRWPYYDLDELDRYAIEKLGGLRSSTSDADEAGPQKKLAAHSAGSRSGDSGRPK
jgi:hypothetical protein